MARRTGRRRGSRHLVERAEGLSCRCLDDRHDDPGGAAVSAGRFHDGPVNAWRHAERRVDDNEPNDSDDGGTDPIDGLAGSFG